MGDDPKGGGTYLNIALNAGEDEFVANGYNQATSQHLMIIITDGQTSNPNTVKNTGTRQKNSKGYIIQTIAVGGIGATGLDVLRNISSCAAGQYDTCHFYNQFSNFGEFLGNAQS